MYIKIHRGSTQIGGNIIEAGTHNTKIILDCGRNLPGLDGSETVDDIDIDGLTSGEKKYEAVFVSHYHSDHCGNINRILPGISIMMGEITWNVLVIIADFIDADIKKDNIVPYRNCDVPIKVGDILIHPIPVPHSAADAHMFLIRADSKTILYTGDYKQVDEIIPKVKGLLNDGERIDVLLTEGTNIAPDRSSNTISTEDELSAECARIMQETTGDVFVLGSSTNIDRINAVARACEKSGRTFAQDLFTACIMNSVGCESAFTGENVYKSKIKGFVWHGYNKEYRPKRYKYFKEHFDRRQLIGIKSTAKLKKLCTYIRPTMQCFLEDLSGHKNLMGSTLIYSMWRGYRRKPQVAELIDFCEKAGMRVVPLHVSGHALNQEIVTLINELNPGTVIPIHCEDKDRGIFNDITPNCKFLADNQVWEIGE